MLHLSQYYIVLDRGKKGCGVTYDVLCKQLPRQDLRFLYDSEESRPVLMERLVGRIEVFSVTSMVEN